MEVETHHGPSVPVRQMPGWTLGEQMRVVGIGVDIVEVARLKRMLSRRPSLLDQVFTRDEQSLISAQEHPLEQLAASFAMKEAAFKALGQGWLESALFWTDVELLDVHQESHPRVRLSGAAQDRFNTLGGQSLLASAALDGGIVIAHVMVLGP